MKGRSTPSPHPPSHRTRLATVLLLFAGSARRGSCFVNRHMNRSVQRLKWRSLWRSHCHPVKSSWSGSVRPVLAGCTAGPARSAGCGRRAQHSAGGAAPRRTSGRRDDALVAVGRAIQRRADCQHDQQPRDGVRRAVRRRDLQFRTLRATRRARLVAGPDVSPALARSSDARPTCRYRRRPTPGPSVVSVQQTDDHLVATLDDGSTIAAGWAVGCDGAASLHHAQVGRRAVGGPRL